jgi:hypothetical protein
MQVFRVIRTSNRRPGQPTVLRQHLGHASATMTARREIPITLVRTALSSKNSNKIIILENNELAA